MTQAKATADVKFDKATHRPWQVHRNEHGVRYEVGPVINTFFTCAYVSGFYSDEAKANAELIVTAVNERDALLSEVAQLREALDNVLQCFRNGAMPDRSIINAAESALAKER
jgi:hypothetical protein